MKLSVSLFCFIFSQNLNLFHKSERSLTFISEYIYIIERSVNFFYSILRSVLVLSSLLRDIKNEVYVKLQEIQEFVIKTLVQVQQTVSYPVPYSCPRCRSGLYRVLMACVLTPHSAAPSPLQCAVGLFSAGCQDKSIEVGINKRILNHFEYLMEARLVHNLKPNNRISMQAGDWPEYNKVKPLTNTHFLSSDEHARRLIGQN